MTLKHILPTILLFAVIYLSCFSSCAQYSSDTITVKKFGRESVYSYNNRIIRPYQLSDIAYSNKEAAKLFQEALHLRVAGGFLGGIGGFVVGFTAGHTIVRTTKNVPVKWAVVLPFLAIGSAFIICSISFEVLAKQRVDIGVRVFNNSIKQKNSANLNLGISTNGMIVRLNF